MADDTTRDDQLETLRTQLTGRLLTSDDPEYDTARLVVAGQVDARPAAIARVANAADVALVVSTARKAGLELAVRSGGHDTAGHGTSEGGLVIDLRAMNRIEVDPADRTAWAEAGASAGEVVRAVAEQGLVVGFGDTGSVGIGGITLGGGIGYFVRKHGMTIDNLLAAEIVTADGQLLHVDAEHHPDLFWAIRGGGGNFGVATRFRYRLHPAEQFVGGLLVLPATAETISGFLAAAAAAPEELSTIANVMSCPPIPFVPQEWHGRPVLFATIGHLGTEAAGLRAISPFRTLAQPIVDQLRPMRYPEIFPPEDTSYRPKAYGRTFFTSEVGTAAGQAIVDAIEASDAPMRAVQLRALGGAMARVANDTTAFAHRDRQVMVVVVNFYLGPDDLPRRRAWVHDLASKLSDGRPGAYVNFMGDEGPERVREAYPGATWDRLAAIKAQYDPDNVFRLNQNVPPES